MMMASLASSMSESAMTCKGFGRLGSSNTESSIPLHKVGLSRVDAGSLLEGSVSYPIVYWIRGVF